MATVATGNVHAHARERAPLQDAFVALRNHTTLDASEPLRRGNFAHVLAPPEAMAARFPEHPGGGGGDRHARRPRCTSTCACDLGYRYPGSEDAEALAQARRDLLGRGCEDALPAGQPRTRRRAARGWRRSCG